MKPTLEDRKKTIEKEAKALEAKAKEIAEVRDNCNRQLSQIQARVTQLQGQFQIVEDMIKERDEVTEKKETPKKNGKK